MATPTNITKQFPDKPSVATEDGSTFSTRGIYFEDREHQHLTAYDVNKADWSTLAEESWPHYAARPYVAGQFQWTGFDYRGEETPFGWPAISSQFGILDTCGFPKDNFYYYQAWWSDHPVLHLLPHWNWPGKEGQEIELGCTAIARKWNSSLTDESQGRKTMQKNSHLEWKVKYAPGILLARGYNGGKEILTEKIETTGAPAAVQLAPNHAGHQGRRRGCRHHHRFTSTDAQGRQVPDAANKIHFELTGPGKILGVGNGDPSSHEPDVFLPTGKPRAGLAAQPVQRPRAGHRSIHKRSWRNQTHRARRRSDTGYADHSIASRNSTSGDLLRLVLFNQPL